MTMFSMVCVAALIVTLAAVEALKRRRQDADLRQRWNDRPTRRC